MKIVTLTLNPAFDIHCELSDFAEEHENFVDKRTCDVGGKGINIARALQANGIDCMACVLLGRENCREFEEGLQREDLAYRAYVTEGRIRENLTLHPIGKRETRISFEGFSADTSCLSYFEELLGSSLDGTFFCLTGSLAPGMDKEEVKAFLLCLRAKNAKIVLDSRSFALDDLLEIRPFLIKPNLDELRSYTDRPLSDKAEIAAAALDLHRCGIDCVLVTMGADGAILATEDSYMSARVPKIHARSTVGAGDSTVAGYLTGILRGESTENCLRLALSFGSAACLREGTQPPLSADIARLYEEISVFHPEKTN